MPLHQLAIKSNFFYLTHKHNLCINIYLFIYLCYEILHKVHKKERSAKITTNAK